MKASVNCLGEGTDPQGEQIAQLMELATELLLVIAGEEVCCFHFLQPPAPTP